MAEVSRSSSELPLVFYQRLKKVRCFGHCHTLS